MGKSQDQFLSEMEILFGDSNYDFSKAIYTGARKPLEVVCRLHGSFYPMPTNLLKGRGCRLCGNIKGGLKIRKDTEFFIKKSVGVHGDRYDYSKSNYTGNDKPVEIVCNKHGSFFQTPFSHYSGSGCSDCVHRSFKKLCDFWDVADKNISSRWEIISKHDDCNFKITDKVTVLCKEHDKVFESNFYYLLGRKSCCDIARYELVGESQKVESSIYKKVIYDVHGDSYEYPEYPKGLVSSYDKIDILCKDHGAFSQTIHHHAIRKQGCPDCAKVTRGLGKTNKWLPYAVKEIENALSSEDMYTLKSDLAVRGSRDHFTFICTKHGEFGKSYGNFMKGQRCPECNVFDGWSKSAYIERGNKFHGGMSNVYLIKVYNDVELFYKVGITFHSDIRRRFPKLDMPYKYEKLIMVKAEVKEIVDFETKVHYSNKPYHYSPNLKFGGSVRECFTQEGLENTIKMFKEFKENLSV